MLGRGLGKTGGLGGGKSGYTCSCNLLANFEYFSAILDVWDWRVGVLEYCVEGLLFGRVNTFVVMVIDEVSCNNRQYPPH